MDGDGLRELFAPFGPVRLKRMFSGHAVFADETCFALALRGEVFLKADEQTQAEFASAGSRPFAYDKADRRIVTSYWLLPAEAFDDPDELRRWCALALGAARRADARKKPKRAPTSKRRPAEAGKGKRKSLRA